MAKRALGEDEAALWRAVMQDVTPLRSRQAVKAVRPPKPPHKPELKQEVGEEKLVQPAPMVMMQLAVSPAKPLIKPRPVPHVGVRAAGLDDTQWRRLSRGQLRVDARLDLHGYIVQEAFEVFHRFMQRGRVMGWRCVEIVTGLGSGARGGTIRQELPLWLQRSDIAPMVLGVVHSHRGNQGALRLLLRKKR
ncbi:Smr/MutS family protein [Bombella saccharophila]|uniref:Smr/MutS family protein n=1 Tax=Bombella saccharophila TaxID=2967338 RepID=A0ABT3W844_9PROT|nr:Smr/MutS family protein [Bombella saccharophila]MCX5613952.1 Smr/MutS family protein [Bombella saccharophila]